MLWGFDHGLANAFGRPPEELRDLLAGGAVDQGLTYGFLAAFLRLSVQFRANSSLGVLVSV